MRGKMKMNKQKWFANGFKEEDLEGLISRPGIIKDIEYSINKNPNNTISGNFTIIYQLLLGGNMNKKSIKLNEKDMKQFLSSLDEGIIWSHNGYNTELKSLKGKTIETYGTDILDDNDLYLVKTISNSESKLTGLQLNFANDKNGFHSSFYGNTSYYMKKGNPITKTAKLSNEFEINQYLLEVVDYLMYIKPRTLSITNGKEIDYDEDNTMITKSCMPLPKQTFANIKYTLTKLLDAKNLEINIGSSQEGSNILDPRFYMATHLVWELEELNDRKETIMKEYEVFDTEEEMNQEFQKSMLSRERKSYFLAPIKVDFVNNKVMRKDGKPIENGPLYIVYAGKGTEKMIIEKITPEQLPETITGGNRYEGEFKGKYEEYKDHKIIDICQEIKPKLELVK